jgi:hypothetical protein
MAKATECTHPRSRVISFDVEPWRCLEQCLECKGLAFVTMDNVIVRMPLPRLPPRRKERRG